MSFFHIGTGAPESTNVQTEHLSKAYMSPSYDIPVDYVLRISFTQPRSRDTMQNQIFAVINIRGRGSSTSVVPIREILVKEAEVVVGRSKNSRAITAGVVTGVKLSPIWKVS